jgi:virginiamycin B lyase
MQGRVREHPIPSADSQPRALTAHPNGTIWFVETNSNALGCVDRNGNIVEHRVPMPGASLRGVTVARDGDLWYTANAANKVGRMSVDGRPIADYDIPRSSAGARCIMTRSDGRLFFGAFDAGSIFEVVTS